jgi:hypothetical protein
MPPQLIHTGVNFLLQQKLGPMRQVRACVRVGRDHIASHAPLAPKPCTSIRPAAGKPPPSATAAVTFRLRPVDRAAVAFSSSYALSSSSSSSSSATASAGGSRNGGRGDDDDAENNNTKTY